VTLHVKQGGTIKTVIQPHIRQGGTWRPATQGWVKQGGVWKLFYTSAPPPDPVVSHTAYGKYQVINYDAKYAYSLVLVSGTAGATIDGTGLITIANVNSRYRVECRWAASVPDYSADYAERKAYTYHQENHQYACGSSQCNCRSDWASCGCACGGSGGNCSCYGNASQSWGQCGCPGNMCWYNQTTVCDTCTNYCDNWVSVKDGTPAGYADEYGEWSKVS
jgi:hypothetical protein